MLRSACPLTPCCFLQYDAIVTEVRRVADPEHRYVYLDNLAERPSNMSGACHALTTMADSIKFVGLALETRSLDWMTTFLNKYNHAEGIPLDAASFHFYANAKNRTDPVGFEGFFPYALPRVVIVRQPMTEDVCVQASRCLPAAGCRVCKGARRPFAQDLALLR